MKYWVQYHNYDNLGYLPGSYEVAFTDLSALDTADFEVSCVTTKKRMIRDAIGDTVFFIVGYGGRTKRYVLWSWCLLTEVTEREDDRFDARGTGQVLNPPAELTGAEFEQFKRQNGNFGLGFQQVTNSTFLPRLIALSEQQGGFVAQHLEEDSPSISRASDTAVSHFVSYHSADKMGYAYEDAVSFSVGTTKSVERILGCRVWSLSGDGQPRTYRLRDTYIVDSIGPSEQEEFVNWARGADGIVFDPPMLLNSLSWFPRFLKSQSNFSLGLQPIKAEFVTEFEALAEAQRRRLERAATMADDAELTEDYREGTIVRISVNAYERNPKARLRCIEHYGASCYLCEFNFGREYGPEVEGLIHVHHLRPLSEIGEQYTVDPVADLRPVCPNCHAVLHSRQPAYCLEDVGRFLERQVET